MNNDWTDNWHDKLAEYEETPPAGLWEDIKAAMEKPATEVVSETETAAQSQRSLRRHIWISSAASVVLLLGLSLFYFSGKDSVAEEDMIAEVSQVKSHRDYLFVARGFNPGFSTTQSLQLRKELPLNKRQSVTEVTPQGGWFFCCNEYPGLKPRATKSLCLTAYLTTNYIKRNQNNIKNEDKETEAVVENLAEKTVLAETVSIEKTAENQKEQQKSNQKHEQKAEQQKETAFPQYENELLAYDDSYFESLNRRNNSKKGNGLSLSLYASNSSSSALTSLVSTSTEIIQRPIDSEDHEYDQLGTAGPGDDGEIPTGFPSGNLPEEIEEIIKTKAFDAKHHRPLRVGVSLSYPLNDRLSLTSGVSFVRLVSDITNNNDGAITNSQQKLTYVGIPLGVTYKLVEYKALSLYLAAGGMIEKCVSGKGIVELDDKGNAQVWHSRIEKRPQYSVFGGAGLQLSLGRSFSLFAEPRVSYYPDNHSQIINIYKDQPTVFDLNLGVRIMFNK